MPLPHYMGASCKHVLWLQSLRPGKYQYLMGLKTNLKIRIAVWQDNDGFVAATQWDKKLRYVPGQTERLGAPVRHDDAIPSRLTTSIVNWQHFGFRRKI